jgi:hypothetical protein
LTNALGIAYGGTGATTANAALNALLPAQTGNATKYLQTDGSNTSWDTISISTADITGTLPVANGGTGATTAAAALTSLGAYAATNPSGYTTNLGTVTSVGGTGTVNGLTLTGTVSTSGNLTLGGTLDLSAYSAAGAFSALTTSGAVGIGRTSPPNKLTIQADATGVSFADNGIAQLLIEGSTDFTKRLGLGIDTTNNVGVIQAQKFGTAAYPLAINPAGGNVGIGIRDPSYKLDIFGSGSITTTRIWNGGVGGSEGAQVLLGNSANYTNAYFRLNGGGNGSQAGAGSLNIGVVESVPMAFYTANTERGRFTSTGFNVTGAITENNVAVVTQSDVGTAPNQIPLNQYLGSMAFQDRESVNFTGGTGTLSSLDIAAISAQLNVSAVDVFVYDTAKDSDGGAWRKRTQHTSWYNEPLNTATRGARREFPAVAVIVATTGSVTIYDGDAPDLPMWMVFTIDNSYWLKHSSGGASCVSMLNATLVTGGAGAVGRLSVVEFIADRGNVSEPGYNYVHFNISRRNIDGVGPATGSVFITNISVNDVAMTVLPNAPVDTSTGLPVPTIAVATASGVSVIKDNGTVTNLTWAGAALRLSGFNSDNAFCAVYNSGNTIYNVKYKPPYNTQDTTENYYYNLAVAQGPSLPWNPGNEKPSWGRKNEYVIGTTGVLRYLGEGSDGVPAARTYNVQTSTYSSGYMVGDIKGAWLSDTTQETVIGTELITNGTFDSSTTGWSAYPGYTGTVLSVDTNRLKVFGGGAQQSFSTIIGKTYVITYTLTAFNPGGVYLGTAASGVAGFSYFSTGSQSTGTYTYTFTATSTTAYIGLFAWNAASEYAFYDNVSVRLADPDRSPNFKALQVFGTITKTPVAAGADLVAYSGWGSSNYLNKPIDSAIVGTTTRFFAGWMNCSNTSNYQYLMSIGNRSGGASWGVSLNVTSGNIYVYDNVNSSSFSTSGSVADGQWHFVCVADTGNYKQIYLDGKLIHTVTTATYTVTSDSSYYVGVYSGAEDLGLYPFLGSLALQRFSHTIPNADQILKIYNDEKYLFQPNAKATLYGTSDAVTALAYDTDTQLLHVGTSSGRSVFDGLRRVDNTTTGVSATISAVDGLIAEN